MSSSTIYSTKFQYLEKVGEHPLFPLLWPMWITSLSFTRVSIIFISRQEIHASSFAIIR